ncbi:MAG TPA: dihydroorotate dehydrogenase electron transfer subunit [Bacteroidales bacterium]|nr:dihydroorotate dehydrogenase electron transfer subunit [Bacteroidales bacterium]HOU95650.1 dihydroorotate dehydrogenase electron transfer subunit [Bacteroidales bacterium]HQG36025.1 dihydroorotate dehydrogenase electron transfer subunit [Bacteroidales bacterium]HQG53169.1 dihydroorotate dehydrogenase electron transfer subunit [Bacteroidales bacterium]HQJ20341.1 dihydroorotate dehydrogenase electron transfer subunit [Bacteroidales bacterium]
MTKLIRSLKIIEKIELNQDFFILELLSAERLPLILPGQFVHARIDNSKETFLRRPFSVHDIDYDKNTIKLLIQKVGRGTESLARLSQNDYLNVIYPLGNSFSMPNSGEKVLIAGGGTGVAPLFFLAKYLYGQGFSIDIVLGFRNRDRIIESNELVGYGNVFITTEDGSEGIKGIVTDHPVFKSKKFDRIYCCGPLLMMKAVGNYAKCNQIYCEVSLENLMACGIGICLCCVEKTIHGNLCTCTDGPVFNLSELLW